MPMQGYFLAGGAGIFVAFIAAVLMIRPFRTWRAAWAQENRFRTLGFLEIRIRELSSDIADREALISHIDLANTRCGLRAYKLTAQEKKERKKFLRKTERMKCVLYQLVARRTDLKKEIRAHQPTQR